MTRIILHDQGDPLELRARFKRDRKSQPDTHAEPVPVEIPEFLQETDPRDAEIAALKAALAQKAEAPKQWSGDHEPPAELSDLISYHDTPAEANDKLLAKLREVLGQIGLEEDDGRRAAIELYRKKDRLESGIHWNRGRMTEQI